MDTSSRNATCPNCGENIRFYGAEYVQHLRNRIKVLEGDVTRLSNGRAVENALRVRAESERDEALANKKMQWLLLAQTIFFSHSRKRTRNLADQIMVELMVVPEDAIPDTPQEMWNALHEYIDWSSTIDGEDYPDWYNPDWIGTDW